MEHTELTLLSNDGVRLAAHRWLPEGDPLADLLIVHGYAEHAGRYSEFAEALTERGIASVAIDLRGHGHSDGPRGYVRHYGDYFNDVAKGLGLLDQSRAKFMLGHSHGALLSILYATDRGPDLKGVLLSNPYLGLALKVPALKLLAAKVLAKMLPRASVPSGLESEMLTHDEEKLEAHRNDPLVFNTANALWFYLAQQEQARVKEGIDRLDYPLYYVYSDSDPLTSVADNRAFSDKVESPDKTVVVREGEFHEVLNEVNRQQLYTEIGDWILAKAK